jgi:hypothetical protein
MTAATPPSVSPDFFAAFIYIGPTRNGRAPALPCFGFASAVKVSSEEPRWQPSW